MHATIRRYDGVDQNRITELTGKVNETLVPKLRTLPGFKGYFLIEAGNGVFSSLGLFETPEQGEESTRVVTNWIHDEKFETADAQRAQDHERQDHRSEQRARGRVTRPHLHERGGRLAGPLDTFKAPKLAELRGPLGRRRLLEWRQQQDVAVDDRLRDVDELVAVVLGVVAEHLEGAVGRGRVAGHQDALGLFD